MSQGDKVKLNNMVSRLCSKTLTANKNDKSMNFILSKAEGQ